LLGTCGWSYAEWQGILNPQKQGKLKQYSSIFPTTEINSTFYRLPEQGTVLGWARHTPANFVFSAKLPQTITTRKRSMLLVELRHTQFLETMKPLTDTGKLTCVLVQLPPFLIFNADKLESFLSILSDSLSGGPAGTRPLLGANTLDSTSPKRKTGLETFRWNCRNP
jgi:uncharacterized protein YecE (DUF72 family)